MPRVVWIVFVLLYAAVIPWWVPGNGGAPWLGLPHWVVLSLAGCLGVAIWTNFVIVRWWRDAAGDDGDDPSPAEVPDQGLPARGTEAQ